MADLFGDSSDSDSQSELKLNEDYAKNYDKWRQKEELQKLKDKYGEDPTLSSSSSEESEDEDAEELTSEVEKKFLETLSALKSKDPKIYSKDVVFFEQPPEDDDAEDRKKKKKVDKPMYLKDYERKIIVEKEGVLSDEDDDDVEEGKVKRKHDTYATAAEEEELKRSLKAALDSSDDEGEEDDDDDLLTTRQKSKKEEEEKEEDYVRWLKGEVQRIGKEEDAKKLGYLHDYWNSGKLEESERFLRDFILNKRYLERSGKPSTLDEDDLSDDEAALEQQDTFEHKYNYRFEEPDQEFIKKYPRTLQDSMRRKNESRKQKRLQIRERKLEEKKQKREEINQLKALKRKEIMDKIEKLKEITGNDQLGFADADIDGDFDPEEYDRRMNDIFNTEYYSQECEEQKPEYPSDEELEYDDWDNWQGQGEDESQGYQHNDEVSAEQPSTSSRLVLRGEADDSCDDQEIQRRGKKWKKSHFAQAVSKKKPLFNPAEKSFQEYFDEYYKLDFEDIVGGMPTRFHYRQVTPNNFGLSVEEILSAKDKELNKWCSVKKTCQYRTENEELQDVENFRRRANNFALKKKIFTSLSEQDETEDTIAPSAPAPSASEVKVSASQKRKRRRKKQENGAGTVTTNEKGPVDAETVPSSVTRNDTNQQKLSEADPEPAKKQKLTSKTVARDNSVKREQKPVAQKVGPVTKKNYVNKQASQAPEQTNTIKKRRKKKTKKNSDGTPPAAITQKSAAPTLRVSDNRLRAYGLNPKKVHRQMIYGGKRKQNL